MSPRWLLSGCLSVLVVIGVVVAVRHGRQTEAPSFQSPGEALENPLTAYRGKTVLLVMGMPGCPGTEKITAFFSSYAATKPPLVELFRIDVPAPGDTSDLAIPWSAPFRRQVDSKREVAKALDFFSYPTFYVIDPDGVIRFVGPFDQTKVEAMVAAITAEKPGSEKPLFSPSMPGVGSMAADFTGITLDGKEASLAELKGKRATLLFFGSTTCPFSRQASLTLPGLAQVYANQGLGIAIINQGQEADDIRDHYARQDAPVIVDADSAISLKKYGVWAVPFCFVLDSDGKVLARLAYTEGGGKAAVAKALGLSYDVLLPQSGAG